MYFLASKELFALAQDDTKLGVVRRLFGLVMASMAAQEPGPRFRIPETRDVVDIVTSAYGLYCAMSAP